jgi:hypothetical protein
VLGATYFTKRIPQEKLEEIISGLKGTVVSLGGAAEKELGENFNFLEQVEGKGKINCTDHYIESDGIKVERGLSPKYKVKDVFRFRHRNNPIQEWKVTKIIDNGQPDFIYEFHSDDIGAFCACVKETHLQIILHDQNVISSKFEVGDKLVDKYSEPYPIVIEVVGGTSEKNKNGVREYDYRCAYSTKEDQSRQFKKYHEYNILDFPVVSKETPIGPYEVKEPK